MRTRSKFLASAVYRMEPTPLTGPAGSHPLTDDTPWHQTSLSPPTVPRNRQRVFLEPGARKDLPKRPTRIRGRPGNVASLNGGCLYVVCFTLSPGSGPGHDCNACPSRSDSAGMGTGPEHGGHARELRD